MSAPRGFATRQDSVGGGFDYMLPHVRSSLHRYLEELAEVFFAAWVSEIDLLAFDRAAPGDRPAPTVQDVDQAFSAVMHTLRFSRRSKIKHLTRRAGLIYCEPYSCSESVRSHFERQAQLFLNEWAAEIEQHGYNRRAPNGKPTFDRRTVARALNAAVVNTTRRRQDDPSKTMDPAASHRASRRGWFWSWMGWLLTALGGPLGLLRTQVSPSHHLVAFLAAITVTSSGLVILAITKFGKGG